MVTNQDGLGSDSFPEDRFWGPHNLMMRILENEGITWREVIIDRSFPKDNSPLRKPAIGRVKAYTLGEFDLQNSFVIGDRITDMLFAKNLGAKGILIGKSLDTAEDHLAQGKDLESVIAFQATDWQQIISYLKNLDRQVSHDRGTKETSIQINLNLDGSGKTKINTGIGFFDHMLDQIGKHGQMDLEINVKGDLHIDEHHTIEDTGLALGETFKLALGNKRGMERYGYALPMDESRAQVLLDFGGRPDLVWQVDFQREMIGGMPTEMFKHFFKSFSDTSLSNLNIMAEGENEHHKIEAIFKAFARAIRRAVKRDMEHFDLPTTKGML
jgi:imidazoleglycerol-phosphate dehydratase/histidinol-phosphatase